MCFIKKYISVLSTIILLAGCNSYKSLSPEAKNTKSSIDSQQSGRNSYKSLSLKYKSSNSDTDSQQSVWEDYDTDIYTQIKKAKYNQAKNQEKGFLGNGMDEHPRQIKGHNRDTYTNVERSKLRRERGLPNNAATDHFWRSDDFGRK